MQLRKIVDDVLDLSKIEEGKLQVEAIPFRPSLVVNTVASQLCLALEDKNLQLIIDIKGFTKVDMPPEQNMRKGHLPRVMYHHVPREQNMLFLLPKCADS